MARFTDFFLISNSPGELAGWVRPVVLELKKQIPEATIEIFLKPCQFQSGTEKQYALALPGVSKVWEVRQTLRFCWQGFSKDIQNKKGAVLFLGGDQYYGKRLSQKLGWPLFVYTRTRASYPKQTTAYFVPSEKIRRHLLLKNRIPAEKIITVGDLVVDALTLAAGQAELKKFFAVPEEQTVITFMPSSRLNDFRHLLPFFLKVAEILALQDERLVLMFNVSDFIAVEVVRDLLKDFEVRVENEHCWRISRPDFEARVIKGAVYEALKITDLLVTIPGTNTQQAAFLGIPMLVLLPLNHPEVLQFEGLLGLLGNLPVLGVFLKKLAVAFLSRKKQFFALPNIAAQKYVVPEIVGVLEKRLVAERIQEMVYDKVKLAGISQELKIVASCSGAAERMVGYLFSLR